MELAHAITRESVENAVRACNRLRQAHPQVIGEARLHAKGQALCARAVQLARDRNPLLLLALDKCAQVLRAMSEEQAGPHGFDVAGTRVPHAQYKVFLNAYTLADGGRSKLDEEKEMIVYQWHFAAAGILAGLLDLPA
jgi:hypothetical protein